MMSPFTFKSVNELPGALGVILRANSYADQGMMPVIMGKSGVGKSYAIRGFAERLSIGSLFLNLSQMDTVDLRGVPGKGDDGFAKWLTMALPFEDVCGDGKRFKECGLIVFDEMDRAQQEVLQTVIPLISSHELEGRKISRKWHFVACCNGQSDEGSTIQLQDALLKRGCFMYIDNPSVESVVDFGSGQGWDDDVLKWGRGNLGYERYEWCDLRPPEVDKSNNFILPPRSLMFMSALCKAGKELGAADDLMLRLYQGVAGTDVAVSFMTSGDATLGDVLRDPFAADLLNSPVSGIIGMARELNGLGATPEMVGKVKAYIKRHRKEAVGAMVDAASRECPALVI